MRKLNRNRSTGKSKIVFRDNTVKQLMDETIRTKTDSEMLNICEHISHITRSHKVHINNIKDYTKNIDIILKYGYRQHHNELYKILVRIYEYFTYIDLCLYPKEGKKEIEACFSDILLNLANETKNYLPSGNAAETLIPELVDVAIETDEDKQFAIRQYISQIYFLALKDNRKNIINSYFNGYNKGKILFSRLFWPITFEGGDIFDLKYTSMCDTVIKGLKIICDYMSLKESDVKLIPNVMKAYADVCDCVTTYWESYLNHAQQESKYLSYGSHNEKDICSVAYQIMIDDINGYAMDIYPLAFSDNYPKYFSYYYDDYDSARKEATKKKVMKWLKNIHKSILKDSSFSRYYIKKYVGDVSMAMRMQDKSFMFTHDEFIHKMSFVDLGNECPVVSYIIEMIKDSRYPVLPEYTSPILIITEKIKRAHDEAKTFNYSGSSVKNVTILCSQFAYIWKMNTITVEEMFRKVRVTNMMDKKISDYLVIVNGYYNNPQFLKARYISIDKED